MKQVILHIAGMQCMNCIKTVRRIIKSQNGVKQIEVQLTPGKAVFTAPDNFSTAKLKFLIEEQTAYKVISIDEYGLSMTK